MLPSLVVDLQGPSWPQLRPLVQGRCLELGRRRLVAFFPRRGHPPPARPDPLLGAWSPPPRGVFFPRRGFS
jgi:hypothetical protein